MEPLEDRNLCSTIFTNLRALRRPTSLVFGPDHNLYVASSANHAILRYDGQNGHMLPAPNQTGATFVASVRGTIGDMTFGPDGNLYVSAFNANRVFSYDAASGVLLGAIGGAELRGPTGLAFAADGTLCVSSFRNNQVLRYDAPAGTFLGTLIANGKGGPLAGPRDLAFAADGALCVASSTNNRILRYDGTTGAFLDILSKSVRAPRGMSFETDGNLYIGSNKSGVIVRYTYVSGPGAIPIVAVKLRNVGSTRDFTFGVDGNLYVVNSANNRIRRIDAATGKMLSFFGQTVNRTNVYIDHLDIHRFEINGSDYLNPAYSPLRLGKSEAQLNRVYDYDFRRLYHVEYFLTGVNRPSVLRYIFNQVTAGAANDTERQLRILTFLQ